MTKRLAYYINHFAIDDNCQNPTIYGSPRKSDIDGVLSRHPTWRRLTPRVARKHLAPRGSGIQFLQSSCGNAERCGWVTGYVPAATVPLEN